MENKINLEELMLKQLDVTLTMRSRIESKMATYLAVISLILTALLTFVAISFSGAFASLFHQYFILVVAVFCIGLIEMIFCALPLIPGPIWYFYIDDLMDVYEDKTENEDDFEKALLKHNQKIINKNEASLNCIRKCYQICSIGLFIFILGFIIVSVLFFISMGGVF